MTNATQYLNKQLSGKRCFVLVQISILLIVLLMYLLSFAIPYNNVQTRQDASGFEHHYASRFFYFYWYTGYFPLATLDTNLVYSNSGAQKQISDKGDQLIMEYQHWSRLGEHARITCYLPDAFIRQTAREPSVRLFNALFFLFGLLLLYRGFYKAKIPFMGLIMVVAILCTPYFPYEMFRRENIFALQPCVFFMVLGFMLPFIALNEKKVQGVAAVIFSAGVIAFCSEIRNEISVVWICLMLMIILCRFTWRHKLLMSIVALIFFVGCKALIRGYFDKQYQKTVELVSKQNGHVYTGKRIQGHQFWHPVFCGLGDFDTRFGYAWNDTVAYHYAVPILNKQYGMNLSYSGKLHPDNYYDSAGIYYIKFDEIPEYEKVVKEKVLSDIQGHPLWYAQILFNRLLSMATHTLPFPGLGFAAFIAFIYWLKKRNDIYVKLMLITMPLSATALLIYSGKGATYNGMFGYIFLAAVLQEVAKKFVIKKTL